MKHVMLLAAIATASLLSGCNKAEKAGEEHAAANAANGAAQSPQEAGEKAKAALASFHIKPGLWENSYKVEDIDFQGMPAGTPPGMMDHMKSAMNRASIRYCVSPEEAEHPGADFLTAQKKANCTYKKMDMGGGVVSADVLCSPERGGQMAMRMTGRYAPDSYDMKMDMRSQGMGGAGAGSAGGMSMHMKARSSGKWIGPDCPAGMNDG